ncbi:hypothetical protein [Chromobacterium violaceum]|uniref:hypothetical protein n=1 Tax=Chromobacterium violaceum TaxID=536 RepID=UPI003DA88671
MMLGNVGTNNSVTPLSWRPLDPSANAAGGLGGGLRAVRSQAPQPARAAAEVKLVDAGMQLLRQGTLETLRAMSDRAYQVAEPARPRWVDALRLGPRRHPMTPDTVAILHNLSRQLAEGSGESLDIRECARLSLQMEKLAGKLPADSPLAELSERLALQGQAAWAQLARAEAETQLLPQFQRYDRPGAGSEKHAGVSVGAGLGLGEGGAGAKATFSVGLGWGRSMDNDDEGFVFQNKSHSASASAGVKGGVGIASLSGGVEGRVQKTRYREYNSAKAFVHLNAEKLRHGSRRDTLGVGARAAVGALIRLFRPGHGNELQHYHRLQQQAADQQQRLGVLQGWLGQRDASSALPGGRAPVVPSGDVVSVKGSANARAAVAGVSAGAVVSVERIDIQADSLTPYWQALSAPEGAARSAVVAAQRQAGIEAKAQALFDGPKDKAGTRPLSRLTGGGAASSAALRECSPAALRQAAERLGAELDHFCAVAQQLDAGVGKRQGGAQIEKSIVSSWQGKRREDALANMALAHAALLIAARSRGDAGEAERALKDMAARLYAPPVRHNAEALSKRVAFRDTLELQIRNRSYALDLGGGVGPLGVKLEASLTEQHRVHLNPVRAGDYKDLRVTLSGSLGDAGALNKLKDALAAQLAPHGLADALPAALAGMETALTGQLGAGATLLLRFYRPQYQGQADFPQEAAGFRLQLARVVANGDASVALSGGVPLQPGVSLELGLSAGGSASVVAYERWGDNTLTAPMMHYLHLQGVGEPERWQGMADMQKPALSGLFRQLADPGSAVRKEAEYFLKRQPQDGFGERFFAAMSGFSSGEVDFDGARAALDEMMQRQLPLWQADKLAFPGLVEQPLAA